MDELILLIKRSTDLLNNQTKTRQQETFYVFLTKSLDNFSLHTPLNLKEGEEMLVLTSFAVNLPFFTITKHKNIFAVYAKQCWTDQETIEKVEEKI